MEDLEERQRPGQAAGGARAARRALQRGARRSCASTGSRCEAELTRLFPRGSALGVDRRAGPRRAPGGRTRSPRPGSRAGTARWPSRASVDHLAHRQAQGDGRRRQDCWAARAPRRAPHEVALAHRARGRVPFSGAADRRRGRGRSRRIPTSSSMWIQGIHWRPPPIGPPAKSFTGSAIWRQRAAVARRGRCPSGRARRARRARAARSGLALPGHAGLGEEVDRRRGGLVHRRPRWCRSSPPPLPLTSTGGAPSRRQGVDEEAGGEGAALADAPACARRSSACRRSARRPG